MRPTDIIRSEKYFAARSSRRRLVLVTGGAGGLGAGIAHRLAEQGYGIAITERPHGHSGEPLVRSLHALGVSAASFAVDITDVAAIRDLPARVARECGPIDILVHAAGPMEFARFASADPGALQRMLDGNVINAAVLSYAMLPHMREQGFGRLLFFGMTGSSVTRPAVGLAYYGAAKAALVAFARTLSLEEARHGITVNVIEPGDIRDKDRRRPEARAAHAGNPSGHAGSWEDVADAAAYLVSEAAGFVNGAVLAVGGGLIDASE